MTEDEFGRVQPVIATAQRLNAKLHAKLVERGVRPIDTLIAATYSAHQLATVLHGDGIAAVEWMRDAVDTIERQVLARDGRAH